ncbi:sirohydrochlorin chelatase [Streptomyces sp. ITFR-6]|uniref:sirohydrochlorin chelatase n=1 Tax=Streptomyces sp. ITFR-6 TaxID=3075197 RepID=UPI0037DA2E03
MTRLLDRVRELRPGLDVRLGHIELNAPLLPETLEALGDGEAVLVPLLLGRGYHVKQDIPEAVAGAPALRTRTAAPLGPHPLLVEALHGRLAEAGWRPEDDGDRGSAVVPAAAPLGAHPAMARLLHRYDQARAAGVLAQKNPMNTHFLASA